MGEEQVSATAVIDASAEVVFELLADPTTHAAIDGTGWVTGAVDDWSAATDDARTRLDFPPFPPDHFASPLAHLSRLATS